MADTTGFLAALAGPEQPQATYLALARLADDVLGLKQFTMMTSDEPRGVVRRIFSDAPGVYPVGGEKPMLDNAWTEHVFNRRQTFVGNSIEELAAVFPDWELIRSLGLESCLNLPVIIDDKVVGTLNCLNVAGHFTQERIKAAEQLRLPGAVTFLLATRQTATGVHA